MERLRQQPRDFLDGQTQLDASGLPWGAPNQSQLLEFDDHPMDGGRGDSEESLHVGLGGRTPIDEGVGVDEGEILALLLREPWRGPGNRQAEVSVIDGPEGSHHERTVSHHADI